MKTGLRLTALAGAALLLAGGCATAQAGGQRGDGTRLMRALDKNGDGTVSHEEFMAAPQRRSAGSPEEVRQRRAERFVQLDRDGNGRLTREELMGMRDGRQAL